MTMTKSEQRRLRILLVIADPGQARKLGCMLAQAVDPSCEARAAATLRQATDALSAEAFDAVLLNLSLSDSQGLGTLEPIQAATRAPILVLADNCSHVYMEELVQRGIQGYLPLEALGAQTLHGAILVAVERGRTEQVLRQAHAKYHAIIEELEDAYFEVDLKGNYTYLNQAAEQHFQRSRHEIIGANYKKLTTEEHRQKLFKAFSEVYRTGISGQIVDNEILRPDGTITYTEMSVALIRDEQGRPTGFRGISRDVTERKSAERALRASEERYRLILASIEDGYYELDLNGRMTFFNDAMAKISGYDKDWLLRVDNRAYMHPDVAEKVYRAYNEVYRTGKPDPSLQYEIIRADGARRFMECSVSLMVDAQGRPIGFRGVARDVTERKQAEQELAEAKARAEEATRAKSEFLANMSHEIRTPMNGIIGMYNLLMTTELSPEQADFVETGKRSADSLLSLINDILDFSKIEAGKLEIETIDFDLRKTVEEMVSLPALQAHLKGLEFACQLDPEVPALVRGDPGRLRQVFMNLAMNAIKFTKKGEVVFHVSLEKEDEKTAVVRFSVKDTGIGIPKAGRERLFQSFQQVDASTTRMFGGTGLGLAIAKQLTRLMDGTIGLASKPGEGSNFWFTLRFEKQPDVPVRLFNLPETVRTKRILIVDDNKTNLTILAGYLKHWGCACDQATSGEMALSLMHAVAKAGAPYDLVISDMLMPGMDGAELGRRIKADAALKEALLIMLTSQGLRGDAAAMREIGFAAYLTKPVRRSQLFDCIVTVLNRVPAQQVDFKKGQLVTSYSLSEAKRRSLRILLAEDNAINQKLAMHLLARFGFRADAVANGREAVQALSQTPYDLVLMDVQMPEMDGLAATRAIRDPDSPVLNHSVPIVAMTAHAMIGDRDKCLAAGMSDYVAKPIQPNLLLQTIERLLGVAPRPASNSGPISNA
ncbi:MAG: response regulator [Desulfobacterales bacterium]|nr:response regulator [Desulfobacterales bacterium]